ncbi:magnesium/cobalt transporter CorA [Chitinophaga horti]|uniref:Magnesium transport protein CorA n=1 Tax=Chitinophaga horti TaxID=2920382 RepID=A0ABY6J3I5_9BACT|nr:magnesium/cobalt transporter CorA [Chitinophaga horti]UYQ92864.1 magnesium/cobalt transporter CorA [Chitinophaga horti]
MLKRALQPITDVLNPFKVRKPRIMNFNPVDSVLTRPVPEQVKITVFEYNERELTEDQHATLQECTDYRRSDKIKWINVDGLRKEEVNYICKEYGIHYLLEEDILSVGQRAKMDEVENRLFCLLPMVYFKAESSIVEQEQVSLVMGPNFVISFQEDPARDVFDPIRERLRIQGSKVRNMSTDYLFYSLLDIIVDNYFIVLDKLGERIELMEDVIPHQANKRTLARINYLRKEMLLFKRAIAPVRELVNGLLKSENDLLAERTEKYFKDVYDHIVQATEMAENYRDMVTNLLELYHTQTSLKMNEVMKVLAVVTTLMAPLTVIAGIYGMNFDNIPELHTKNGYFVTLGIMGVMLVSMIVFFRKRGWF